MKTTVKLRDKNNRIYFDVIQDRKHKWIKSEYLLSGDAALDKQVLARAEVDRARLEEQYSLDTLPHREFDFLAFFKEYLETHSNRLKLLSVYNKLSAFCEDNDIVALTFDTLDTKFIHNYVLYCFEQRKNTQNTVRNDVVTIKSVINYALKIGACKDNKIKYYTLSKHKVVKTFLTAQELNHIISLNAKRNRVINAFIFCCSTGLRLSDVQLIKYNDITKTDEGYVIMIRMKKTADVVIVPLSSVALDHIDVSKIGKDEVIYGAFTKSTTHTTIKSFFLAAGISKHVSFHTSRHTFATLMYSATRDILQTQKLCGHRDLDTTMQYVKLVEDQARGAILKFDRALLGEAGD